MANVLTTLGWCGFALGLLYFVIYDRFSSSTQLDYIRHTRDILIVSAGLVLGGYVFRYLGSALGVGFGKCKKCGKRIEKQEMFCFDHRIESIRLAQDRVRRAESGKYKKSDLRR